MKFPFNGIVEMVSGDAVVAGYGVVSSTLRRMAAKVLKSKGVGDLGVNAASMAAGLGLSHVNNPHVKVVGSALRISSIASIGNNLVSSALGLIGSKKSEEKNEDSYSNSDDQQK